MHELTAENLNTSFSWTRKFAKYWAMTKVNAADRLTYATNILARSATVILRIWIFTQLYEVTYQAIGVTEIDGLQIPVIIWLLMLTQSFQAASRPTVANIITEDIRSGDFAYRLGKPYSYLLSAYVSFLGRYIPNVLSNVIIGSAAALLLVGTNHFGWLGIAAGLILLFLGLTVDFLVNACIGLLAFWTEDTLAFQWIYQKAQIAFGGVMLPIALFPEKIRTLAEVLPFSQLFYSGARLMARFDRLLFERYILIQVVWIGIFGVLVWLIFKRGIRNVSVNGG